MFQPIGSGFQQSFACLLFMPCSSARYYDVTSLQHLSALLLPALPHEIAALQSFRTTAAGLASVPDFQVVPVLKGNFLLNYLAGYMYALAGVTAARTSLSYSLRPKSDWLGSPD